MNEWTLCAVGQGSFPPSHTFNGFFAADLNGDGRQDLIASWSGKEAPSGENERGKITIMTAMGGGGEGSGTMPCPFFCGY